MNLSTSEGNAVVPSSRPRTARRAADALPTPRGGGVWLLALLTACGSAAAAALPATRPALEVKETTLYRIPTGTRIGDTVVSPDGAHIACVERRDLAGSSYFDVCLNSVHGPNCPWVVGRSIMFSLDGSHFCYQVQNSNSVSVVVEPVDRWLSDPAAAANEKPAAGYWMVGRPLFSRDGRRCAFAAQEQRGRFVMVCDGGEGQEFDAIDDSETVFSPDGSHLAYRGTRDGRQCFVLDQQPGPFFQKVGAAAFSPNSQRFGYHADSGSQRCVILNGVEGTHYQGVAGLTFSPDSRRYAYVADKGKGQLLVVDGREFHTFNTISEVVFSPDSHHIAIATQTGNHWNVIVDGKPSADYDGAGGVIFSPDSRRTAFVTTHDHLERLVLDGVEQPQFDGVRLWKFSPDSQHVAHIALRRGEQILVVDGRELGPSGFFGFSPDGRHVARSVPRTDGKWTIAVDDTTIENVFDGFPQGSQMVFDSPASFHAVAGREEELMRVDVRIH